MAVRAPFPRVKPAMCSGSAIGASVRVGCGFGRSGGLPSTRSAAARCQVAIVSRSARLTLSASASPPANAQAPWAVRSSPP